MIDPKKTEEEAENAVDSLIAAHANSDPISGAPGAHPIGAVAVNATDEDAYWRDNFRTRPYVRPDSTYDAYHAAYQFGWESHVETRGRTWEEVEPDLRRDWETNNGQSTLPWSEAGSAVRDAWERIEKR